MTAPVLTAATRERLSVPRWVHGGVTAASHYALSRGCPCCGNMGIGTNAQNHMPCEPAACRLCGSVQCNTRAQCHICLLGIIPGWSGTNSARCGYKGCDLQAVATIRRKLACMGHAWPRAGRQVEAAIAHRDAGAEWERWTLTGPRVGW